MGGVSVGLGSHRCVTHWDDKVGRGNRGGFENVGVGFGEIRMQQDAAAYGI